MALPGKGDPLLCLAFTPRLGDNRLAVGGKGILFVWDIDATTNSVGSSAAAQEQRIINL
jgi:hypothetical protein